MTVAQFFKIRKDVIRMDTNCVFFAITRYVLTNSPFISEIDGAQQKLVCTTLDSLMPKEHFNVD